MSDRDEGERQRRKQRAADYFRRYKALEGKRERQKAIAGAIGIGVAIALITGVVFSYRRSVDEPPPTTGAGYEQPSTDASTSVGATDDSTAVLPGPEGTTSVGQPGSDPKDDFIDAEALGERGFSLFEESPPPGMDILDVSAVHSDGRTTIRVRFAGSYRDVEADPNRSVSIRPVFVIDGSYGFEIEYRADNAYLSSSPEGTSMLFEWVDDTTIQFSVDGFVPADGDEIRVSVFSRLATDEGDAVAEDQAITAISR